MCFVFVEYVVSFMVMIILNEFTFGEIKSLIENDFFIVNSGVSIFNLLGKTSVGAIILMLFRISLCLFFILPYYSKICDFCLRDIAYGVSYL